MPNASTIWIVQAYFRKLDVCCSFKGKTSETRFTSALRCLRSRDVLLWWGLWGTAEIPGALTCFCYDLDDLQLSASWYYFIIVFADSFLFVCCRCFRPRAQVSSCTAVSLLRCEYSHRHHHISSFDSEVSDGIYIRDQFFKKKRHFLCSCGWVLLS